MLAALKFFLGQDERDDEDSDDDKEPAPAAPSREDMYRAKHKVGINARVVAWCRCRMTSPLTI